MLRCDSFGKCKVFLQGSACVREKKGGGWGRWGEPPSKGDKERGLGSVQCKKVLTKHLGVFEEI